MSVIFGDCPYLEEGCWIEKFPPFILGRGAMDEGAAKMGYGMRQEKAYDVHPECHDCPSAKKFLKEALRLQAQGKN